MEFDELSNRIIGCALEVHRNLGPGLLESIYEQWPRRMKAGDPFTVIERLVNEMRDDWRLMIEGNENWILKN
ncbi:MAG: hypothetical protein JRJ69_01905 [Deltaproteobacteria bacterium]|nr:hypothetical protein [Deltaproteobacteria bacterium]MBW1736319.1 hypothetical protein [Deltaproteobacteria bacterium]MBW1908999.1 hypothetical protein [Deltaproteobacteria bacterium]MBW2033094.1 hypothetical protein [Deltaproteobacteria bacterium]MBW2113741.1 hypothetical protein [Deltaproteobacteria bacterium]